MICTNTDHYVNTLSTIKKKRKKKINSLNSRAGRNYIKRFIDQISEVAHVAAEFFTLKVDSRVR